MNVSDFRKRVKEMIEKTEQDANKKAPPPGQSSKSRKDFDDAKVGMSFLILKNCLMASEALAETMGADLTGLHTNCLEDPLFVSSWDAYSRDMLSNREFSPGMMVCFCLTSQMIYTYRKNTSRFRDVTQDDVTTPDTGNKRERDDPIDDNNGDNDEPPGQCDIVARPPTPPRGMMNGRQPPSKKRATIAKTYNFEDYSADDLDSDDSTSDEE